MPIPRLRDFLEPAVQVSIKETLIGLMAHCQQQETGEAIAIDEQGLPLGRLQISRILSLLHLDLPAELAPPPDMSLEDLLIEHPALLQPVTVLPADWAVTEGWHWLHASDPPWVLVDEAGKVLGTVDAIAFWRHFAVLPAQVDEQSASAFPDSLTAPASQSDKPPPLDASRLPAVGTGKGAGHRPWRIAVGTAVSPPSGRPRHPAPLAQGETSLGTGLRGLVEGLPVPMLLWQADRGTVACSQGWQQDIGEEPRVLEAIAAMEAAGVAQVEVRLPPFCHLGAGPSTGRSPKPSAAWQTHSPAHSPTHSPTQKAHTLHQRIPKEPASTPPNRVSTLPPSPRPRHLHPQDVLSDSPDEEYFPDCVWQLTRFSLGKSSTPDLHPLWLVMAQDVTEQHQMARELAAKTADLAQLNRLKDEFLSCISHELKTPLTAVLGLSSLLKEQLVGPLNDRQARYAQLIYQSGRHLTLIVNDILDLTRIETGQLELNLESVEIASLCHRAYEQARQLHQEVSVSEAGKAAETLEEPEFSLSIQPGLSEMTADDLRLRQMLTNLLSNALKFTPTTGKVGLEVATWDDWVAFTVWDTGIGIAADKQHLIFQKFQQLENPLTRRFEGTGLGLVLTQRIARLHGGDITFLSEEGKGSRFTVLLPKDLQPCPTKLPLHASRKLQQRLVLVAESGTARIEVLDAGLRQLGYRVAIARSGTEALEKVRRLQPALVILNPNLPLLSGWDVLTLLKAGIDTRATPVIWSGSTEEKPRAIAYGASACLSYPIHPESLRKSILEATQTPDEWSPIPANRLTVLHLRLSPQALAADGPSVSELLHSYPYRVVEVSDLDQADLLARVWKPHVVVLEGSLPDPTDYFNHLYEHTVLSTVPMITLTPETTQSANRVPGLTVFPCLAPLTPVDAFGAVEESALFQVIQVASGRG
ncbi:ATP-binding protein [Thermoleptolyngbya sp. C42_A2020_037]|uniref:ATP-binding response regulator n=1 Tax=Thermoleptolyngbya sp. C42_A2020_037 TaxID=2747799 RepID=UPI0019FE67D7|nr:ATP-binding protein [Thermoleptolyngbya sp. C42_A2020_037]MBF2086874.1 response regulator [Thermoleptolyngbya sp. C42_A2020_037]